jgi:hypothetical protein
VIRFRFRRERRERLRELGENEAYGRSYGERREDVRIVKVEPRRPRFEVRVTGEHLRRRFEELLDARGQGPEKQSTEED